MTKNYLHAIKKHFVKSIYSVEKIVKKHNHAKKISVTLIAICALSIDTHNPLGLYISRNNVIMVLTLTTFPHCVVY